MIRFLRSKKGFTLVELMIVVAIIGILAGVAIPRYMNFVRRSREGATKGNLGAVRSAMNIYYSDTEGIFPSQAGILTTPFIGSTGGNYLDAIPVATEDCANSAHKAAGGNLAVGTLGAAFGAANGGWIYQTAAGLAASTSAAGFFVNCNNVDTKSNPISKW